MAEANPLVTLVTNMGDIQIELYEDDAPNTVANFVNLAEKGYYDNTKFHRVIKNFMIQGGDPESKTESGRWGTGGPGYRIADEFSKRKHEGKGVLSMANAGPNTNGSQFFVTVAAAPWLDKKHSIFGEVIEGYDVVDKISKVARNSQDRPNKDVQVHSVKIERS